MIWALFEVILPLLLTFILGLITGWLLWRWRRRRITASEWNTHTDAANAATENLESIRAKHDETVQENSRLSTMMKKMGTNLDAKNVELTNSIARNVELKNEAVAATELRAQLEESKSSITNLQAQVANAAQSDSELDSVRSRNIELAAQLGDANTRIEELERSKSESAELERSLNAANEKLAATEKFQLHANDLETRLNSATMQLGDFDKTQSEVISLREQLAAANSKVSESENATAKVGRLEAQLRAAEATVAASEGLVAELEEQLKQASEKDEEVEKLKSQTADLTKQVNDARALSDEQSNELANAKARVAELEAKASQHGEQAEPSNTELAELKRLRAEKSELASQLTAAQSHSADLENSRSRTNALEAQLNEASNQAADSEQHRARILDLENQLQACKKRSEKLEQAQDSNSSNDVLALKADIEKRDQTITDLERRLAEAGEQDQGVQPDDQELQQDHGVQQEQGSPANTTGAWRDTGQWKKGVTKLGTPGSDHKDDLKVINGIGAKMEKLLNSFDIQSWEQLAVLTDEEVQTVDAALTEFPGRIKRDEWVMQAREIMANGHVAPDKKSRKRKKQTTAKPTQTDDWRSGTTHFGTPGSSHRDDLKKINGIGPVLEKTLNDFGIQSWEQLAELNAEGVGKIDQAISFPGRIEREEWVPQAKELVERFPDRSERPYRKPL